MDSVTAIVSDIRKRIKAPLYPEYCPPHATRLAQRTARVFVGLTVWGVVSRTFRGVRAISYFEEKKVELPYRGMSERRWRDFDNDDAIVLGGSVGLLAMALYSRRFGGIRGWRPWVGAAGYSTAAGLAGREGYSFLTSPSGWYAAFARQRVRREEAAK